MEQFLQQFDIVELSAILMFFISFYGLIISRSIIKSIIFIVFMEVAVVMFWLSFGFRPGLAPPIIASMENIEGVGNWTENWMYYTDYMVYMGDPLPQALMITAIIIGLSVTAVNTIMFITLYRKYKTTDWDIAKQRSLE